MIEKFKKLQNKYPNLSSAMCFIKLVKDKKIKRKSLEDLFNKLVDKLDYIGTPKKEILDWLSSEITKK